MKETVIAFSSFLTKDIQFFSRETGVSIRHKMLGITQAYVTLFLFKLIWGLILFQLEKQGVIPLTKGAGNLDVWIAEVSVSTFVWQVLILAPLLEETAFRGFLQKEPVWLALSLCTLFYLLVCKSLGLEFYSLSMKTAGVMAGSALGYSLLVQGNGWLLTQLAKVIDRGKTWLMWLSAASFAFWHYHNYEFAAAGPLTVLLVLFPLFISGLFFTWTSLRHGFLWGIALHMLTNAIPVLMTLLKFRT